MDVFGCFWMFLAVQPKTSKNTAAFTAAFTASRELRKEASEQLVH